MGKKNFSHLHVHTEGSILDGHGTIEDYVETAARMGQPALGTTDHGNMYKTYELINACQSAGITPVPGVEFYVAPENPEGAKVKSPVYYQQKGAEYEVSGNGAYLHMTVWAYNQRGLKNLFDLSRLSFMPENFYMKPRIDFNMLETHSEGLIVATGCPSSEISTRFNLGQDKMAYEYASKLKDVFGRDRVFVEIMEHGMKSELERGLLPKQLKLAKDMDLNLLATNDCHYVHSHDAPHQEEMLCINSSSRMSELAMPDGGRRFAFDGNQYYMKSEKEMLDVFKGLESAVHNTAIIAEMAQDISLRYDPNLRPKPHVPDNFSSEQEYFMDLIAEGAERRYGNKSREVKRKAIENIKKEVEVFVSSDYVGYMLTVYEYIKWAQDNYSTTYNGEVISYPTGVGRGSVGGSTVAYVMGISETDPIEHDLLFERFLSAGRGNSYEIVLEDGTKKELVASARVMVEDEDGNEVKKYVHQVEPDDVIVDFLEDKTTANEDDVNYDVEELMEEEDPSEYDEMME